MDLKALAKEREARRGPPGSSVSMPSDTAQTPPEVPTPRAAPDQCKPPETQRPVVVPLGAHQRLRDEFTCPITRQLVRMPVIAADGHTYDRQAIETWLVTHNTSPKDGSVLASKALVPNHNLKRLVDDLVREGGAGLYDQGDGVVERRIALEKEPVLLLKCLGPAESEWHARTFEVRSEGCVGGRKRGEDEQSKPFMAFGDTTVSRRHFELLRKGDVFMLRDLGSASGTFARLRRDHFLKKGETFLVGKHQLRVEALTERHLQLKCIQAVGSPLPPRVFDVGTQGATLGRKAAHVVAFSRDVEGTQVGVDSSVSNEHARVVYDAGAGGFVLKDAASTNGTWLRLSGPGERSACVSLHSGDEVLVGSIRFLFTTAETVVERDL